MQVTFENGWFLCRDAYSAKDELRNEGFEYLGKHKAWGTRAWNEILKYKKHFDEKTKQLLDSVMCQPRQIDMSDPNVAFWFSKHSKLDPIQKMGVNFALTRNHSYLAFEAGVGKTATAIVADKIHAVISEGPLLPALYIVPPNMVSNWVEEFKMWRPNLEPVTVTEWSDFEKFETAKDVILCADSLFTKDRAFNFKLVPEAIREKRYRTVIIDEAHRFINFEAERTKEVFGSEWTIGQGLVHNADKVILLSGTHMRRGPINLYAPVFALAWNLINYSSSTSFGVRFCNGYRKKIGHREVWDFSGSSREDELNGRLYNKFILEKTLEEARPELKGKKIERVVTLNYKKPKKITGLEKTVLKKKRLSEIIGSSDLSAITAYRQWLAIDKVKIAYEYIADALDNTDKPCAIFAIHHETIDMLLKVFAKYKPREISGRVKMKDREKIEKEFQSGDLKLIIWQVQTAYGRNAQSGNRCFFVESPWSPDEIDQAINRFYRRGQKNTVVADHIVLANTLDQYVLKTCLDKKETINKVRKGYQI